MSAGEDNIRQSLQKMVKNMIPDQAQICEVTEVDTESSTCDVQPVNGDAEIFGVKLQAEETEDYGVIPIPKKGSKVIISWLSKNVAFVSLIAELESYMIQIDSVNLFLNADGININGDDHGGLTITPVLRTELNKMVTRMTAHEVAIIAFAGAQSSAIAAVPLLASLGPGYTALTAAMGALPLNGAFNTNIENDKVNHGSN